ncbi:TetR/AcrR family transcriptional regulator [Streptomyces sp. NPDC021224]|uniref:TetR/AcrR family transcriptional regulator n=1 Tax=unclassified Streptomyces TaxID=2593676 RepID=UPI0037A8DB30
MPGDEYVSIWMRPERPQRSTPGPRPAYSRAQITATAVAIADAEGLDAASMRRIAADLGTGAMSLYRYTPRREDLIELMVDAVAGEMNLPDRPTGDWRADLSLLAHERRALWRRHPWLASLTEGHPVWGPNSLRVLEFTYGALDGFGLAIDEVTSLVGLISGYVAGVVRTEVGWEEEARRTNVDMRQWMSDIGPYVQRLMASGKYPMFARVIRETQTPWMEPDARFRYGLDRVLDSIAATLPGKAGPARRSSATDEPKPPSCQPAAPDQVDPGLA